MKITMAKKPAKATTKAKSSKLRSNRRLSSLASSLYNAARYALGPIVAMLAANRYLWRNDGRDRYQHTSGALIDAQNQEK